MTGRFSILDSHILNGHGQYFLLLMRQIKTVMAKKCPPANAWNVLIMAKFDHLVLRQFDARQFTT